MSDTVSPVVAQHLHAVRARIDAAAKRSGRDGSDVTLVAVTKGHAATAIAAAVQAGCADVGENYVQEMLEKMGALAESGVTGRARWHLIGPLQRNKARHVAGRIALLHTLDSESLARELDKRAAAAAIVIDALVQVNVGGEPQKSGVEPAALGPLIQAVSRCARVHVRGLMTMPPFFDDPGAARPYFRALAVLRRDVSLRLGLELRELSMGMSGDYEVAIEEGATIVRVGTAIFGERPNKGTHA